LTLAPLPWRFRDCFGLRAGSRRRCPGASTPTCCRAGAIPDPYWATNEAGLQWIDERDWEYAADFEAGAGLLAEEVVELVADGLDTLATVRRERPPGRPHREHVHRLPLGREAAPAPGFERAFHPVRERDRYIRTHRKSHRRGTSTTRSGAAR
jgi:beta-mannosidase